MKNCILVCLGALAFGANAAYTVNDYVKGGLVLHFDAEYNQGTGQAHDSSATTWVDLSGNGQTATKSGNSPVWGTNASGKKFMNPSSASGFQGYVFTPVQAVLDAVNSKPAHVTYETCGKVLTFYTDMSFWGFKDSGGKFGVRYNGSKTSYFAARGSEKSNGTYSTDLMAGLSESFSYDGSYVTHWVNGSSCSGPTEFAGGSALTTGGGKLGSCVYSSTKSDFELHAARLYNRALRKIEVAHNATVDRVRYYGAAEPTTVNVDSYVSLDPWSTTYGTATPPYNKLTELTKGSAQTFSIAGLKTSAFDGEPVKQVSTVKRAVYEGFDLTTIAADGTETTTAYPKTTTSVSATVNDATFAVWKWRLQYGLIVTAGAGGKVVVSGGAATGSSESWHDATNNAEVVISAVPDENSSFLGWSGDVSDLAGTSTDPTRTAVMTKGRTIIANFVRGGKGDGSTYTWKGGGATTAWTDGSNWEGGLTPLESDHVVVSPSAATTIALSGATPRYASLTLGDGEGQVTLTVANWTSAIQADTVTIGAKGLVRPLSAFGPDESSNRIWIVCNDFKLKAGGQLNANERGWRCPGTAWYGAGPGGGMNDRGGAGYGGRGSNGNSSYNYVNGRPYGSIQAPTDPGSGGGLSASNAGGVGGGAVRIEASGNVCIDGDITANGQTTSNTSGGGSGGGVYISAATVEGSGTISARGGRFDGSSTNRGGGGGGRISIVWSDAAGQAAKSPTFSVNVAARCWGDWRGGRPPNNRMATNEDFFSVGSPGTIYLTDGSFYVNNVYRYGGQMFFGTAPASVTLPLAGLVPETSADASKLPQDYVFHDVNVVIPDGLVLPTNVHLSFTNCTFDVAGSLVVSNASVDVNGNFVFDVPRDLVVKGAGTFAATSGPTNGPAAATWNSFFGAEVRVGRELCITNTAVLYPGSDKCNGGSVKFTAGRFLLGEGSRVYGKSYGWGVNERGGEGAPGIGPGGSPAANSGGAAHGGFGGGSAQNKKVYGNAKDPDMPGSEGAHSSGDRPGGWGGGLFHLTVAGKATIDGTINMNGAGPTGIQGTGGSGGAVNIRCGKLVGTGSISANGGYGAAGSGGETYAGPGGGGRIAISATDTNDFLHVENVTAAAGTDAYTYAKPATDGTVYWKIRRGMLIIVR